MAEAENRPWHVLARAEVLDRLAVNPLTGLDPCEADRRLEQVGPNQLATAAALPWWRLLAGQFRDFMVLVLLAATAISYALGERADALTIVAIVAVNAVLGFIQEYRAERSLAALREFAAPTARVRRGGAVAVVPAAALVPGDVVLLEAGDRVPADGRLLVSHSLTLDEAALTGESVPVGKAADWAGTADTPLGDRRNMAFAGTAVSTGRGEAVLVATGMETEMGRIAGLMQAVGDEDTPLQRRLEQLGRSLVAICLGLVALVVMAGAMRGEPLVRMFLTGVSLAVAAIPEGLPAIVTLCLALGVQRMIRRRAIVRRLQAVETLGCATAILSDKTGTLTRNEMMVRAAWCGGVSYTVSGDGYDPRGAFHRAPAGSGTGPDRAPAAEPVEAVGGAVDPQREPALWQTLASAALASNAVLVAEGRGWAVQGDPTEGALMVAAAKGGYRPPPGLVRRREIPFSSERRRMSVLVQDQHGRRYVHLKGAPATVLDRCTHWLDATGAARPLTPDDRRRILGAVEAMAAHALRVLAVAFRPLDRPGTTPVAPEHWEDDRLETEAVFCGLLGAFDPPRPEVKDAIRTAARAGIRTAMITGDHPATALAVARELGIATGSEQLLTGTDLPRLSDTDLVRATATVRVFARVSPADKLRIVRAFKARGEIVAMTGDGVNDAPAVKEADIGVAMGRTGTDVTREASQLVLADDNYATIVAAVEEGRGIYDNIRKFIRYLLACNTGEVLLMFLAAVARLPLPLLPMQILWVNLVTDGLPALALGVDAPDPDVMRRSPRRPDEGVFSRGLGRKILGRGLLIGAACTALFACGLATGHALPGDAALARARTLALAGLVLSQLLHVFDCRSERRSIWAVGWFTNPWLVAAVISSLLLLLAAIYFPPLAVLMETVPLAAMDWAAVLLAAAAGEVLVTVRRVFLFGRPGVARA